MTEKQKKRPDNGKGDIPRPKQVSDAEFERRWNAVKWRKNNNEEK